MSRTAAACSCGLVLLLLGFAVPAFAGVCDDNLPTCGGAGISVVKNGNGSTAGGACGAVPSMRCSPPTVQSPSYARTIPSCDPNSTSCAMTATVAVEFPRNSWNYCDNGTVNASGLFYMDGGLQGQCGDAPWTINTDFATFTISRTIACGDTHGYAFQAAMCGHGLCGQTTTIPLDFVHSAQSGCPVPLPDTCTAPRDDPSGASSLSCSACQTVPGDAGARVGDGKVSAAPAYAGNASLRYAAGGVGGTGLPGVSTWRTTLGMFWSHDYAERIVVATDQPAPNHVWFLTRYGSFKEFKSPGSTDGSGRQRYTQVAPSDEFRQLYFVPASSTWQLATLDGRTDYFLSDGRWDKTVFAQDPSHPVQSHYNGLGQLDQVVLQDGRSDTFTYDGTGKLQTIVGTPVAGSGTGARTWTLTWSGDLLDHLDRPDGTTYKFYYDGSRPGYLTRVDLVAGTSLRILAAFDYQPGTSVVAHSWRGDPSFSGSNAVDKVTYAYDNPVGPALITESRQITNGGTPLVLNTTLHLSRDTVSAKPRVDEVDGACSNDGKCAGATSPQTKFGYGPNPLLPATITDALGLKTAYTYDANGRVLTRTEDADNVNNLLRTTTYTYGNASFPGLVTLISVPSTTAGQQRTTALGYNAAGVLTSRAIGGFENGVAIPTSPVDYTTTSYAPNGSGEVLTIDPPGYGTADQVTFTYGLSNRNGHIADSRTDPIIGRTNFEYDGFNRRTARIDPSGARTETDYDKLDRVTAVRQIGSSSDTPPTSTLTTTNLYNAFGDLFCVELPATGNAIEYDHDVSAQLAVAGRLASVTRGSLVASPDSTHCVDPNKPREQTLYSYDNAGNRIQVQLVRCTSSGCGTSDSTTTYEYSCHLDKMTQGAGSPRPSVTEFCYDLDDNLQTVWDPIHSPGVTPSASYAYDELNRLKSVITGAGSSKPATTAYTYDAQDHLASVTDAESNVTTYTTSDRDLLTKETSPVFSGSTPYTLYSYNAHGQLTSRTDPRGIGTTRVVDALDRVTAEQYPTSSLNVNYVYDGNGGVPTAFWIGRLFSVTRGGTTTSYTYDRFGRTSQDGALKYTYDGDGNRLTIGYPGTVTATYAYDFADRPVSLVGFDGTANQQLVNGTTYDAAGPLTQLTLGNNLVESHTFDARYFPSSIQLGSGVPPLPNWQYAVDDVGNVKAITGSTSRTFDYEDSAYHNSQYFLTSASGPWGARSWLYDHIGNRTQETHDTVIDGYTYTGAGHTPLLSQVAVGGGGTTRNYAYDAAGELTQVSGAGVAFTWDDTGHMSQAARTGGDTALLTYDGRGFLTFSTNNTSGSGGGLPFLDGFESGDVCKWSSSLGYSGPTCPSQSPKYTTQPLYSSEGLLYEVAGAPPAVVFYFAGRPVALLTGDMSPIWSYLTTDHLGTPIVETDPGGTVKWSGGFEPFGKDWQAGGAGGASAAGVFLRLPGQWADPSWANATQGADLLYNLNRWYEPQTGRYSAPDPYLRATLGGSRTKYQAAATFSALEPYRYVGDNPLMFVDPQGLCGASPLGAKEDKEEKECRKKYRDTYKGGGFKACQREPGCKECQECCKGEGEVQDCMCDKVPAWGPSRETCHRGVQIAVLHCVEFCVVPCGGGD